MPGIQITAHFPPPLYKCALTDKHLSYQAHVNLAGSLPKHILNIASILGLESRVPKREILQQVMRM
jgi:hypothetical protein